MTKRIRTIQVNGVDVEATDVPFTVVPESPEAAFEYALSDGTILRVRFTVVAIQRIHGAREQDGSPQYFVRNGMTAIVVSSPVEDEPKPAAKLH